MSAGKYECCTDTEKLRIIETYGFERKYGTFGAIRELNGTSEEGVYGNHIRRLELMSPFTSPIDEGSVVTPDYYRRKWSQIIRENRDE